MEDFKNASGENPFLDLMNCPKQGLILPHSNADVDVWRWERCDMSAGQSSEMHFPPEAREMTFFFGKHHVHVRLLNFILQHSVAKIPKHLFPRSRKQPFSFHCLVNYLSM